MPSTASNEAKVRHSEPFKPQYKKQKTLTTSDSRSTVASSFLSPDKGKRLKQVSGRERTSAPAGTRSSISNAKRKLTSFDDASTTPRVRERVSNTVGNFSLKKPRTQSPSREMSISKRSAVITSPVLQQPQLKPTSDNDGSTPTLSAAALKSHNERHDQLKLHQAEQTKKINATLTGSTNDLSLAEESYISYATKQSTYSAEHRHLQGAHGLFSRHSDPSVRSTPPPTKSLENKPSSTNSSPFEFPNYQSSPSVTSQVTPHPNKPTSPQTAHGDDSMVDLSTVMTPSHLEAVEGDDIWSVMMTHTTPRKGRQFSSEHVRSLSEERELQFLRRRRLASSEPIVTNSMIRTSSMKDDSNASPQTTTSITSVGRSRLRQRRLAAEYNSSPPAVVATQEITANSMNEEELINEWEESGEVDHETMEHKLARLGAVRRLTWRHFILTLITVAGLLCWGVIIYPVVVYYFFTPPLPYCDSETSYALTIKGDETNPATALQPFRNDCRSCPINGECKNGRLVSCNAPYHVYRDETTNIVSCMESNDVERVLQSIAEKMRTYIYDEVVSHVCREQLPPPALLSWLDWWPAIGSSATEVVLLVSDLQKLIIESSSIRPFNLSEKDLVTRSLDLALSTFQRLTNKMEFSATNKDVSNELVLATNGVVPWSCRARYELYASSHIILTVLGILALILFIYYKWILYQRERALVERLVKEVRFFLIGRSSYRTERFYPAHHLRENLFDTLLAHLSIRDRTWLRDTVWPKVAALVAEDARVSQRMASVHGQTMIVWEWISSNSPVLPVKRQRTRNDRYSI